MEVSRGVESIPDPNKFDLITHHWNRQGQLTRTNHYILYVKEGNRYYERPVNSGNLWHENNTPAGRVTKTFNDDGVVIKKSFDHDAAHIEYSPKLTGNDELKYQVEQERARATAAEKELAAIKAERVSKAENKTEAKKPAQSAPPIAAEPTLGKVMANV